ncbi:MAG: FAD-binding oxidoreductase [Microbacteriaceae bacterium]|nr:FAD-binding oxidoreductase [Cryobacterium sp.]MBX3103895.1 FAD-binding oxidoreductase [Cryobacterium sp.]MCC6376536.1 FAD-binding oxidoreductase [Microbacteriaceae bacterium]
MSSSSTKTDVKSVIVIGAGMIGLATAWHLRKSGVEVTVVDKKGVAAGSSWGNAGWLTPALTLPLGEPSVLLSAPKTMLSSKSPLYIPLRFDLKLIRFLTGFAWHSLPRQWRKSMEIFAKVNPLGMPEFHELTDGGVKAPVKEAKPFLAGFLSEKDRKVLLHEFEVVEASGDKVSFDLVTGDELRQIEPTLSDAVSCGVLLHGQYFINPPKYMESLGDAVAKLGATLKSGFDAAAIDDTAKGVIVKATNGDALEADAVVIATGAWLGELARKFGVKAIVQAGRGYSFSVVPEVVPSHPIYFPAQRLACTPLGDRLRIGGMMEFRSVDAAPDKRRFRTLVEAGKPVFKGVDWDARKEEWVGGRPVTADGHALIGATKNPRVFVGGGHGMWGIALGPLTGKLLAGAIVGEPDPVLKHFDPLR